MALRQATSLLRHGRVSSAVSRGIISLEARLNTSLGFIRNQQQHISPPVLLEGCDREDLGLRIGGAGRTRGYCFSGCLSEEQRGDGEVRGQSLDGEAESASSAGDASKPADDTALNNHRPGRVTLPQLPEDEVDEEEESDLPWQQRASMVRKALNLNSSEDYAQAIINRYKDSGFEMKVMDINRTVKVTKGGKVQSYTALVVCGNGRGVVGFGKGKSSEVSSAVPKAFARALSDLHFFESFKGSTIYHEQVGKYKQTKLYLWPARLGCGIVAGETVGTILKFAGFTNVKSKIIGSRHPHNTVKATFKTLGLIKTPAMMAALNYNQADAEGDGKTEEHKRAHFSKIEAGLLFEELMDVQEQEAVSAV